MAKKKRRYGKKASEEVGEALHKLKRGKQRSGTKGKAKSREQAIAIGLSKARKEGAKVPPAPKKKSTSPKRSPPARRSRPVRRKRLPRNARPALVKSQLPRNAPRNELRWNDSGSLGVRG